MESVATVPGAPSELTAYEGEVEAVFEAAERELLEDLFAVVEAVNLKPVRLTKSGIPPKPLWAAINQRLVWKDPPSVLHDWDEVDQVRLAYSLSMQLDLIRPNGELWLETGPGADGFFTVSPARRARLVRRAYLAVLDWDERCDARNQEGSRHNFGRAYRRDFVHDVVAMREVLLGGLARFPVRGWVRLQALAWQLSEEVPDLLLSEVCPPAEVDEEGLDPEKLRFLSYWFTLLGRFGWVDMAQMVGEPAKSGRLCRLTPLGAALVHGVPYTAPAEPPLGVGVDGRFTLPSRPSVAARYVVRALGRVVSGGRSRRSTYQLDPGSLGDAVARGCDLARLRAWLLERAEPLPSEVAGWLEAALGPPAAVRLVASAAAVEVDPADTERVRALEQAGFRVVEGLAVADHLALPALYEAVGGEPFEGFDYPPDEPLGMWKSGPTFHLFYSELPLQHRELLVALEPEGDPPALRFTREKLARLAERGWTLDGLVQALTTLAEKGPSARVLAQLRELVDG
jgi:hypothetical protein